MNNEQLILRFCETVKSEDLQAAANLFEQHPVLKSHVNEPLFAFDTPAIHICRKNTAFVDFLLEQGADINRKTQWWAGGFGILEGLSIEEAQPLIERGAKLDIWAAVGLDDFSVVNLLLAENPELVRAPGGDGKQPLHDAQSTAMIDLLVSRGADVNSICVDHESTALHYQVQNRAVAYRLLEHGAVPDMFMAARHDDEHLFRKCLESRPESCNDRLGTGVWKNKAGGHIYNWTLGHDLTPQQVARNSDSQTVLRQLVECCSSERRFMDAIWCGEQNAVQEILAKDDDILSRLSLDDREMLARAAWWYNPAAIKIMLELGFDPHVVGVHQSTPLDRAAFHGYADIVEMLIAYDDEPPIHQKNEFGGTPLGACLFGFTNGWKTGHPQDHLATARNLIAAGSKVQESQLETENEELLEILESGMDH